jgi:hypothetical protein
MSCNWDVHCIDCDMDAGMSVNHGDKLMRLLVDRRSALEGLEDLGTTDKVWDVRLHVNGEHVPVAFFKEHRGHMIVPLNEHDELDIPCGRTFDCPICGPVTCGRLDHSIAQSPRHYHVAGDRTCHWEREGS